MTTLAEDKPIRLVIINAGLSNPSSTRMLAERAAQKTMELFREAGRQVLADFIDLAPLATDIARAHGRRIS